jgi:hypothetical protein
MQPPNPNQAGAQPYPGQPTPPPAAKSKTTKIVLLIVGAIVVVIVALVLSIVLTLRNNTAEGDDFINALVSGDTATAYDQFSPALQDAQSEYTFAVGVATLELDSSCEMKWTTNAVEARAGAGKTKELGGSLTCNSDTYDVELLYLEEGDVYQLISYQIMPL